MDEDIDIKDRLLSDDEDSDIDVVTDFLDVDHQTIQKQPPNSSGNINNNHKNSKIINNNSNCTNPFLSTTTTITTIANDNHLNTSPSLLLYEVDNPTTIRLNHHDIDIINSNMNSISGQQQQQQQQQLQQQAQGVASSGSSNNMVPIISVTPHSPGAKYNCILEDTLNQLQCIRESVVQMKNSSPSTYNPNTLGLAQTSKIYASCPSLNEINENSNFWPVENSIYSGIRHDRRKSWTAVEDLSEVTKYNNSHKSISLSSLDSEEQESLRLAERVHNRSSRNSTGGISTHSLNEAELARDFERIVAKRNLTPVVCRIPLQKSISTPSIAPIRNQNAKEENISNSQHLSDTDEETQDDRSLLCVRDKTEGFTDILPEKRRKRGSLFFRKKKDKNKNKGQPTNCDSCGAIINLQTYKEHAIECKAKITKSQTSKFSVGKKNTGSSQHSTHHDDSRDSYDGHMPNEHSNYSDETPLMREEFLNESHVSLHELGGEPVLGVSVDEPDSWSPSVPREVVKSLKDKQIKRQEHIYEFIMTEKHHCQTLLIMQKVFVESLQKHFSHLNLERMFPRLQELTKIHTGFLKKLRLKQKERYVVDTIADILLDFFSDTESAQRLKSVYGEFCSTHRSAISTFKCYLNEDQTLASWYKHCQQNPILKKKGIPECHLFVTQRLTKYPLLIDPLIKSSIEDKIEHEKLQRAKEFVKDILRDVDARVAEKEKEDRQLEIFKRIDAKSCAVYKKEKFKKSDIISCNRKLKFEGIATLMQGRSKMQTVLVVVLSDCLFFLQENSQKYTFFTPENKAGVVSLQKLLIREKAGTESRGIYIISSNPAYPEMFELKVQNPKDKNVWIQAIRKAVVDCPSCEFEIEDQLTTEQRQKLLETKHQNIREIICKMRQKDFEQAILLEEKIALQLNLLLEQRNNNLTGACNPINVDTLLEHFGTYRDLVTDDCDNVEIWKRVLTTIQDISLLASSLYTAATGLPFARSFSSVGERQSELYISPTLPKRAETFGGFDERRSKLTSIIPSRDAVLSTISANYQSVVGQRDRDSVIDDSSSYSLSSNKSSCDTINTELIKDQNYAALQVSHHLHTLLCIISQQMTTIQSLQSQLSQYRENPKSIYRHNDQLEELRNLQDKLTEEKAEWLKQRDEQQKELDEQRQQQKALQVQLKADQDDIREQREQLYRKMEILSNQGLLISANTPLPVSASLVQTGEDVFHYHHDESHTDSAASSILMERRKDKWRSTSVPKTPPVNLLSATNAPKVAPGSIPKQTIPLKLSSSSSTKSSTSSSSSSIMSPLSSISSVAQILPYKLADKKTSSASVTPNHSRTGSSPAIIQQPSHAIGGNPATRTNTYPKIPDRYRLRSSDGVPTVQSPTTVHEQSQKRSASVVGQLPVQYATTSNNATSNTTSPQSAATKKTDEEEVIFF